MCAVHNYCVGANIRDVYRDCNNDCTYTGSRVSEDNEVVDSENSGEDDNEGKREYGEENNGDDEENDNEQRERELL